MLTESILIGTIATSSLIGLGLLGLDWQYRRRPGNKLELTAGEWRLVVKEPNLYLVVGEMEFVNLTKNLEIMLPEVTAQVRLLSDASLDEVTCKTKIVPCHKDAAARADDYWFGYIVKTGKTTKIKVSLEITGPDLDQLQSAWIQIHFMTYGPQGRVPKVRHVIFPFQYPDPQRIPQGRETEVSTVFPIKTHLLTELDDPVDIVKRYVLPHAQAGDIVSIAESPVAIMQGRLYHPSNIRPGWVARRLCYLFMPTSSLATACGMQTLVNIVGPVRVLFAFAVGAIAKVLLRRGGVFYQLAGEQARLIDDITGTLPPYDQFIVPGPDQPQAVVDRIQKETGIAAAISDANDLRAVQILAATAGVSIQLLEQSLISNPAGNADERTPVVLIRPKKG